VTGRTNIVAVDDVTAALVALIPAQGSASRDGNIPPDAPKTIGLNGIYRGIARMAALALP
jgi:hypothetical protein